MIAIRHTLTGSLTLTVLALALSGCTNASTLQPCSDEIVRAVLLKSDALHVDQQVDPDHAPTLMETLGDAPEPSCAFVSSSAASGVAPAYVAIWVTRDLSEAKTIASGATAAAKATGLPLVSEVADTDSVANFMDVTQDGTVSRIIVQTLGASSSVIGYGAMEDDSLVVLSATEGTL